MDEDEDWVCQCRRCHGVHGSADAVQYVWEWSLGSCGVPTVVGVQVDPRGHVSCAFTYWCGEPDEPLEFGPVRNFMVSCRPGDGTVPTEGDVARWTQWISGAYPPVDWLLVDGVRFRSVRDVVEALCAREPMPGERTIVGDWCTGLDASWKAKTRAEWPGIVARNRETSRF